MINKESDVFSKVATYLREKHKDICVVGTELTSTPPHFPAVSIVQTNNAVNTEHSTFFCLENVVREEYKAEVFSNLIKGKEAETREIVDSISDAFASLGYVRTFCESIPNSDATIFRRVIRFTKNNVI